MSATKKLGIWMDHSTAHLIEFPAKPAEIKIIESKFNHQAKERILHQGENRMHTKEQHQQEEFYKEIGEMIKNYVSVVLFGPTDAKVELYNILMKDNLFAKIKIEVKQADKMTENQQHAFVKHHFTSY